MICIEELQFTKNVDFTKKRLHQWLNLRTFLLGDTKRVELWLDEHFKLGCKNASPAFTLHEIISAT